MRCERIYRHTCIAHPGTRHMPFLCYQNNRLLQAIINHRMTHLSLHPRERVMAAEALLGPEWLGHASAHHDIVLCGDFNALSWFPSLRRLSRRLADAQTGLDGYRPRPTWFGRYPVGRIDHVLVDSLWTVLHVEVPDDTLARVASDHRPVVVDIAPPARGGNG